MATEAPIEFPIFARVRLAGDELVKQYRRTTAVVKQTTARASKEVTKIWDKGSKEVGRQMVQTTASAVKAAVEKARKAAEKAEARAAQAAEKARKKAVEEAEKAAADADKAVKKLGDSLLSRADSVFRGVFGFMKTSALAGAASVTALGASVISLNNDLNDTRRFAESISISPVFLSGLRQIAKSKGIEDLQGVNEAFEELLLRVEELKAAKPSGELFSSLEDIGAKDFIKELQAAKGPTEAIKLALAAIATETEAGKRIKLADALFGGSNASLAIRRIAETREGLDALLKDIPKFSRATEEQFQQVKRLDTAKASFNTTLAKLSTRLRLQLIPVATTVAEKMDAWIQRNEDLIAQKLDSVVKDIGGAVQFLLSLDWAGFFSKVWKAAKLVADTIGVLIGFAPTFFAAWATIKLFRISRGFNEISASIADTTTGMGKLAHKGTKGLGRLSGALAKGGVLATTFMASFEAGRVIGELTGIHDALRDVSEQTKELERFRKATQGGTRAQREAGKAEFFADSAKRAQEELPKFIEVLTRISKAGALGNLEKVSALAATGLSPERFEELQEKFTNRTGKGKGATTSDIIKEVEENIKFQKTFEAQKTKEAEDIRKAEEFRVQNPETVSRLSLAQGEELNRIMVILTEQLGKNAAELAKQNARPDRGTIDIKVQAAFGTDVDVGER
jgi:BMFP domain-containing protein YqiC